MTRLTEDYEGGADGVAVSSSNSIFTNFGGVVVFDTDFKLFDTAAALSAVVNSFAYTQYTWGSSQTTQYVRVYLYIDTPPASGQVPVMLIKSGASTRAQVTFVNNGKLNIRSPAQLQDGGTINWTGQWVRLEWDLVDTTQTLRIYGGANVHGDTPDETLTGPITVSGFDRLQIGPSSSITTNCWQDGLAVDDTAPPGKIVVVGGDPGGDVFVWDGSTLIAADVFVWDGTTLVAADVALFA